MSVRGGLDFHRVQSYLERVRLKLGITTGVAVVLVGGGIALGLALGDTAHTPTQVVQHVDATVSDSATSTDPSTPIVIVASSAATAPAPTTTEAPVTNSQPAKTPTTNANEKLIVQGPGVTGSDGVLRPPPATETFTAAPTVGSGGPSSASH